SRPVAASMVKTTILSSSCKQTYSASGILCPPWGSYRRWSPPHDPSVLDHWGGRTHRAASTRLAPLPQALDGTTSDRVPDVDHLSTKVRKSGPPKAKLRTTSG